MTTSRQSALLVTPIQNWEGEKTVDLNFKLPIKGLRKILKSLVWTIVVEGEKLFKDSEHKQEVRNYFWIIREKISERIQLGLELELSSISEIRMNSIENFLSGKFKEIVWPPECSQYENDEFSIKPENLHEYFGNFRKLVFPLIKEVRRKSRYHHKLVVGVGYKDKGSSKDEAFDGNPDYQTVSSGVNVKREIAEIVISRCTEVKKIVKQLSIPLNEGPRRQQRKVFIEKSESESFEWFKITGLRFLPLYGPAELTEADLDYLSVSLETPYYTGNIFIRKK